MLKYDKYPESCPPQDAVGINGTFFRLCKAEVPTEEDFLTHVDSGANFPPKKLCEAMALSLFNSYEAADKLRAKFPRFRSYSIVEVQLEIRFGIGVLEQRTGHLNLWESREHNIFQEIFCPDEKEGGAEE